MGIKLEVKSPCTQAKYPCLAIRRGTGNVYLLQDCSVAVEIGGSAHILGTRRNDEFDICPIGYTVTLTQI